MARSVRRAALAAAGALLLAGSLLTGTAGAGTVAAGDAGAAGETTLSAEQMANAVPVPAVPADTASGARVGGPWSDPEPARFYSRQPNTMPACAQGYACMKIKAGSQSWYYDFWYYDYGIYALENWLGHGYFNNRQTGGATVRTYNASGGLLDCYESHPDGSFNNPYWTPVHYIELSPAGC